MRDLLERIVQKEEISKKLSKEIILRILEETLPDEQVAGLLVALRVRGETPVEIAGFAEGILERAIKPDLKKIRPEIDTCGTGGDGKNTWNISTAVSLLIASDGIKVVKHGNRCVSSTSGSADVLERMGIKTVLAPSEVSTYLKRFNFAFLFAPVFHPAMKRVANIRKNLGIKTVFNMLGPLTNPCFPRSQIVGVPDLDTLRRLSKAANILHKNILFYTSESGYDEAIPGDRVYMSFSKQPERIIEVDTHIFGLRIPEEYELRVSTPQESAEKIMKVFSEFKEPERSILILNTALAYLALGVIKDLREGIERADYVLRSSKPLEIVEKMRKENVAENN